MGPSPRRRSAVAVLGPRGAGAAGQAVNHGVETVFVAGCDEAQAALRLRACTAALWTSDASEVLGLMAFGAGCVVLSDAVLDSPFRPGLDYLLLPMEGDRMWDPKPAEIDQGAAAAVIAAVVYGESFAGFAEHARRTAAVCGCSVVQAEKKGHIRGRLSEVRQDFPAASDAYQWPGDREVLAAALAALPAGVDGAMLELGCGSGGTLAVIDGFRGGRALFGIDDGSYGDREAIGEVARRLGAEMIWARTQDAAWAERPLALLHVDAGHDGADCRADLERFAPSVQDGGLLAVDDYMTVADQPGVRRATDEYIAACPGEWEALGAGPKLALWRRLARPAGAATAIDDSGPGGGAGAEEAEG